MTEILCSSEIAERLRGKVVVVTGGAQGIGAATVSQLHRVGAHVFFGDWNREKGELHERELSSNSGVAIGSVHFRQLDVRDYQSQLDLFGAAFREYGRIDVAISCAAVSEPSGWFEPEDLDLESVKTEPLPLKNSIDINLTSVVSFTRIALAYMNASTSQDSDPAIVLVSSIAGITPAPGLLAYTSAKHGIIGLMRGLAAWAPQKYGARVNAICPWATDTQMLGGVAAQWRRERMPMNQPGDVARIIVQCAADPGLNGTSVFVSGGRGFDTEEGIEKTQPIWMGEKNAAEFQKGQRILGLGNKWTDSTEQDAST